MALRVLSYQTAPAPNPSFDMRMVKGDTTWVRRALVSQELRLKLTGHASADMNAPYTHHEFERYALQSGRCPGYRKSESEGLNARLLGARRLSGRDVQSNS
jgi:hypothetical protein